MARNRKRSPEVDEVAPYLEGVAKNLVDRLYGPKGPPWGTRLTELEDVVWAVREYLSQQMLDKPSPAKLPNPNGPWSIRPARGVVDPWSRRNRSRASCRPEAAKHSG